MIKIIVHGASGRMGHAVLEACAVNNNTEAVAAVSRNATSSKLQTLAQVETAADVLIDFSLPEGFERALDWCLAHKVAMVSGTTGISSRQQDKLQQAAEEIPVLWSPNMSTAVHWLIKLVQATAAQMGADADVEIWEKHHRYKQDAPSGTALRLGEAVAAARDQSLEAVQKLCRAGQVGPRQPGEIGFSSVRAGRTIGEHRVLFSMEGEELELSHISSSREAYANGAVNAAVWLSDQPPGHYRMADTLSQG